MSPSFKEIPPNATVNLQMMKSLLKGEKKYSII